MADATNPRGGCWGTTGVIVFVPAAGRPLYRISASGGEATPLPVSSAYPNLSWPHCMPDGRHVLLTVVGGDGGVWLTTLDGKEHRQLSKRTSRMEYADGYVFFGDKGSLFAQPFDERELTLSGEPVRVADSLGSSFGDLSAWAFSVSQRGGALVFWSGQFLPVYEVYVQPITELGRPLRISRDGGSYPEWRKDGRELYFIAPNQGGRADLQQGTLMAAAVYGRGMLFQGSPPQPLFAVDPGADAARRQFWPSPDGQRFLVNSRVEEAKPRLLTVVLNWKEAVKGN